MLACVRMCVCVWTLTEVLPKAGLLKAAKRWSHIRLVVGVDEDGPCVQPLAHVHGLVDVPREHSWGQAKLRVIGTAQHAIDVSEKWRKDMERRWRGRDRWRTRPLSELAACATEAALVWH